MKKYHSHIDLIKDNCIGFGKVQFKHKNENVENKFLLFLTIQNNVGVINLNTEDMINIPNSYSLIQSNNIKKLEEELNYVIVDLIHMYISNYEYSKELNIPIEKLNNQNPLELLNLYNELEKSYNLEKQDLAVLKLGNYFDNAVSIIKEFFELINNLIEKTIKQNKLEFAQ